MICQSAARLGLTETIAWCKAARRIAVRSPAKMCRPVRHDWSRGAKPKIINLAGFLVLPPTGPATPVTDPSNPPAGGPQPLAIAAVVLKLTAPCAAMVSPGTPG